MPGHGNTETRNTGTPEHRNIPEHPKNQEHPPKTRNTRENQESPPRKLGTTLRKPVTASELVCKILRIPLRIEVCAKKPAADEEAEDSKRLNMVS